MVTKNQTAKAEKNSQTTSLLDQVMEQTRFKPENEDYSIAQRGIAEFISEMLKSDSTDAVVNKTLIDEMIVRLDEKISHQVDEILHNQKAASEILTTTLNTIIVQRQMITGPFGYGIASRRICK